MWLCQLEFSEIEAWFETKTKEFVETENRNPNCDSEVWLQKYIYTDVREVFFATFPLELHSWLARLVDCSGHVQSDKLAQWNHEAVHRLKNTDNVVSRAVYFWLTSLLLGFITEFVVDILNLWIKMLLCDNGVLQLRSDL